MFCRKCYIPLSENDKFCPRCGTQIERNTENAEADMTSPETPNEWKIDFGDSTLKSELSLHNDPPPQTPAKKSPSAKLIPGIILGFIALLVFMAIAIWIVSSFHKDTDTVSETVTAEHPNTMGNTAANIMGAGLAAKQDQTIYYIQEDSVNYYIKSMDLNGENEKTLYTADSGYLEYLNVIGSQLFFIINKWPAEDETAMRVIYCLNLDDLTAKPVYVSSNFLFNLYATKDKLYFREYAESGTDKIIATNHDGSNLQTVVKKNDYIFCFSITDDSLYYTYDDILYKSDLDGNNTAEIPLSSELYRYCIADSKLYTVTYDDSRCQIIGCAELDGSDETEIAKFDEDTFIDSLVVTGNFIYYTLYHQNSDYETLSSDICVMNIDGTNQQIMASIKGESFGFSICENRLFYSDPDTPETKIINLNDFD